MPFKLVPATTADADELADIFMAVSNTPRILLENAAVKPEDAWEWQRARVHNALSICDPESDVVAIKLVDEDSGKIASYAQWGFSNNAFAKDHEAGKNNPYPSGTNLALRHRFISEMEALDARNVQDGDYFILLDLVTNPLFKRRGAASQLVRFGTDRADREGKIVILDASPDGFPLYKTVGFVERDRLEIPLEEFGGEGTHVHVNMIRYPLKTS